MQRAPTATGTWPCCGSTSKCEGNVRTHRKELRLKACYAFCLRLRVLFCVASHNTRNPHTWPLRLYKAAASRMCSTHRQRQRQVHGGLRHGKWNTYARTYMKMPRMNVCPQALTKHLLDCGCSSAFVLHRAMRATRVAIAVLTGSCLCSALRRRQARGRAAALQVSGKETHAQEGASPEGLSCVWFVVAGPLSRGVAQCKKPTSPPRFCKAAASRTCSTHRQRQPLRGLVVLATAQICIMRHALRGL